MILIWLFSLTALTHSVPISFSAFNDTQDETSLYSNLWTSVIRDSNDTDLIQPSLCAAPCDRIFNAEHVEGQECQCRCPEELPVFWQTMGQCIQHIEACSRTVKFEKSFIPVARLPRERGTIKVNDKILWKESSIKLKPKQGARCNVTSIEYLGQEDDWLELEPDLVSLGWDKEAVFQWEADKNESDRLQGTLLLIRLNCAGNHPNSHCVTFRVQGSLINTLGDQSHNSHAEIVIIIFLLLLLVFTVIGAIVLWKVCWKLKKNQLVTGLQLQFLYHLKDKEMAAAAEHYQSLANNINHGPSDANIHQQPQQTVLAKRKLFFSPEFFEEQHMHNPPAMANQFLHDLRAMITIAKKRIQQHRHVPNLNPIPEEPNEHYEPYMKARTTSTPLSVVSHFHQTTTDNTSPKSTKSADSGTESLDLVEDKHCPKLQHQSPPQNRFQSRIPVNKSKMKSPKLNLKFSVSSMGPNMQINGYNSVPPLPPRNPPPPLPPKHVLNNNNMQRNEDLHRQYTVFPDDGAKKSQYKSIPRRPKKEERVA